MALTFYNVTPTAFNVFADVYLGLLVAAMLLALQHTTKQVLKKRIMSGNGVPVGDLGAASDAFGTIRNFIEGKVSSTMLVTSFLIVLIPLIHPLSLIGVDFQAVQTSTTEVAVYTFNNKPEELPLSYIEYRTVLAPATLPFPINSKNRTFEVSSMARDIRVNASPFVKIIPPSTARFDYSAFRGQGYGYGSVMEANNIPLAEFEEGFVSLCDARNVGERFVLEEGSITSSIKLETSVDVCPVEPYPDQQLKETGQGIKLWWLGLFAVAGGTSSSKINLNRQYDVTINKIYSDDFYTGSNVQRSRMMRNSGTVVFRDIVVKNAILVSLNAYNYGTVNFDDDISQYLQSQHSILTIDGSLSGAACSLAAEDLGVKLLEKEFIERDHTRKNSDGFRIASIVDSCFVRSRMVCRNIQNNGEVAKHWNVYNLDGDCWMSDIEILGFQSLSMNLVDVLSISNSLDTFVPDGYSERGFNKNYAKIAPTMAGLSTRIIVTTRDKPVEEVRPVMKGWAVALAPVLLACMIIIAILVGWNTKIWIPETPWDGYVVRARDDADDRTAFGSSTKRPDLPKKNEMFFGITIRGNEVPGGVTDHLGITTKPQVPTENLGKSHQDLVRSVFTSQSNIATNSNVEASSIDSKNTGEALSSPSTFITYNVGDRVVLQNLVNASHLNGRRGIVVVEINAVNGRYAVDIDDVTTSQGTSTPMTQPNLISNNQERRILVKPRNIRKEETSYCNVDGKPLQV